MMVHWCNGLQPTKTYTTLMVIHLKHGEVNKALNLVQNMRGLGCTLTVFTYTKLINGKAGWVDEASVIFVKMQKEGCKVDVIIINNVINILGGAGRPDNALKVFGDMESVHCAPNVVTYNTVIKALFNHKPPASEVASWFEGMKADGIAPSSFTYSIFIHGFCQTNRVEKALLLLQEMDEKGFPPCPAAYCSLMNSLGWAKGYEAANELFQELRENSGRISSRVYAFMIKHYGRCGQISGAEDLFNEMKKSGSNPDVFTDNVMCEMVRAGMLDVSYSLLHSMGENSCMPNLNFHNIILNCMARCNGPERAMKMLDQLER